MTKISPEAKQLIDDLLESRETWRVQKGEAVDDYVQAQNALNDYIANLELIRQQYAQLLIDQLEYAYKIATQIKRIEDKMTAKGL